MTCFFMLYIMLHIDVSCCKSKSYMMLHEIQSLSVCSCIVLYIYRRKFGSQTSDNMER